MFYIVYFGKPLKSSHAKPHGLRHWFLVCGTILSTKLFKLCHWGQKCPNAGGHKFYISLSRKKHKTIILTGTTGNRALMFDNAA